MSVLLTLSDVCVYVCCRDRSSLAALLDGLDSSVPPPPTRQRPSTVVAQLFAVGTGKERAERKAAATLASKQKSVRVSRPKSAAPRVSRGRSRSRSCRSCSRSRSPNRQVSPPITPPSTHPPASRGDIHPHAFLVGSSTSCCAHTDIAPTHTASHQHTHRPSTAPSTQATRRKVIEKQKAQAQLLSSQHAHVSAATLARQAKRAAAAAAAASVPLKKRELGVQSVSSVSPTSQVDSKLASPDSVSDGVGVVGGGRRAVMFAEELEDAQQQTQKHTAHTETQQKQQQQQPQRPQRPSKPVTHQHHQPTTTITNGYVLPSPDSKMQPTMMDPRLVKPAGMPTAQSSAREGQRNWIHTDTAGSTSTHPHGYVNLLDHADVGSASPPVRLLNPANLPPAGAASIRRTPDGGVVPQPAVHVHTQHNAASFNIFAHDDGTKGEIQNDEDGTIKSHRELMERMRHQQIHLASSKPPGTEPVVIIGNASSSASFHRSSHAHPLSSWEEKQVQLLSDASLAQRSENAALAALNARRTRPDGGVSWWPEDDRIKEEQQQPTRDTNMRRQMTNEANEQERRLQKLIEQQTRPRAGIAPTEQPIDQRPRHASPVRVQAHTEYADSYHPTSSLGASSASSHAVRHSASGPSSTPIRVRHAHVDVQRAEESERQASQRSPFPAMTTQQQATYAKTFRPTGSAQPLQHGQHDQHRYDRSHRRDSEVSEGEFTFKNFRGAMRDQMRAKRAAAASAAAVAAAASVGHAHDGFIPAEHDPLLASDLNTSFGASFAHAASELEGRTQPTTIVDGIVASDHHQHELDQTMSSLSRSHRQATQQLLSNAASKEDADERRRHQAQQQLQALLASQREQELADYLRARAERQAALDAAIATSMSVQMTQFRPPPPPAPSSSNPLDVSSASSIESVLDLANHPLIRAFTKDPFGGRSIETNRDMSIAKRMASPTRPATHTPLTPGRIASPIRAQTAAGAAASASAAVYRSPLRSIVSRIGSPVRSPIRPRVTPLSPAQVVNLATLSPQRAALSKTLSLASNAAASAGDYLLSSSLARAALQENAASIHSQRALEADAAAHAAEADAQKYQVELARLQIQQIEKERDLQFATAAAAAADAHATRMAQLAASTASAIPTTATNPIVAHFATSSLPSSTIPPIVSSSPSLSSSTYIPPPVSSSSSSLPVSSPTRTSALTLSASLSRRALDAQSERQRERQASENEYLNNLRKQRQEAERRMEALTKGAIKESDKIAARVAALAAQTPTFAASTTSSAVGGIGGAAFDHTGLSSISSLGRSYLPNASVASSSGSAAFPTFAARAAQGHGGVNGNMTGDISANTPSSLSSAQSTPSFNPSEPSSTNSPLMAPLDQIETTSARLGRVGPHSLDDLDSPYDSGDDDLNGSDVSSSSPLTEVGGAGIGGIIRPTPTAATVRSLSHRDDASVDESITSIEESELDHASEEFFRHTKMA